MTIRDVLAATLVAAGLTVFSLSAYADIVAVIGTGRMGAAIGPRFAEIGYTVVYGSRDPAREKVQALVAETGPGTTATTNNDAVAKADIIALALPFSATEELIKANVDNLDGKIIFDITNASLKALSPDQPGAVDSSAGQLIQEWAPKAFVVKAFNTVGYHIVADPGQAGGPVTVPIIGNDYTAKKRVAEIVQAMGFETADSGTIVNAHVTEGMGNLYFLPYARREFDEAFEFYFRKGTAPAGISSGQVRNAD
jgi:predicted dinucleotide-binding enzyme